MRCTTDYSMNARRTTKSFKARIGLAVGVGNQIQTGDEMTTELETRLREIEEWEKAATPGPWTPLLKSKGLTGVHATDCKIYHAEFDPGCLKDTHDRQKRDAEFIAHARGDIPFLVEQVRRLQAERKLSDNALSALQELTLSDNKENPWLGVTASVALLLDENEQTGRALVNTRNLAADKLAEAKAEISRLRDWQALALVRLKHDVSTCYCTDIGEPCGECVRAMRLIDKAEAGE